MSDKPQIYLGLDPGVSGGIGWIDTKAGMLRADRIRSERQVAALLRGLSRDPCEALLEKIRPRPYLEDDEPPRRLKWPRIQSYHKLAESYGFLKGCLVSCRIPFIEMRPADWQRALGFSTRGKKAVSKALAEELYPGARFTHYIAEAVLLATVLWRMRN